MEKNKNIGNRIITKEEATEMASEKMTELENKFSESIRDQLWEFHREALKIEAWFIEKLKRAEKRKSL